MKLINEDYYYVLVGDVREPSAILKVPSDSASEAISTAVAAHPDLFSVGDRVYVEVAVDAPRSYYIEEQDLPADPGELHVV